jgi:DNA mismatch repair ATPase MutL
MLESGSGSRGVAGLPTRVQGALRSGVAVSSIWQALEECVSNSLDAGASEVHVTLAAAEFGFTVADNGAGIPRDDLQFLGVAHATSKSGGAQLLGGRGEALAAICDAAVVEVSTRARGSFETYSAVVRGGAVLKVSLSVEQRPVPGTVVAVRDLLFNRPVLRTAILAAG